MPPDTVILADVARRVVTVDAPPAVTDPAGQLEWLFAASALQALAVHVRQERPAAFGHDARAPETYTLRQLAVWVRPHVGTPGQAFEFAVADALNAGEPGVREPVLEALDRAGVRMRDPAAIVFGLEKAPRPFSKPFIPEVCRRLGERRLLSLSAGLEPERAVDLVARVLDERPLDDARYDELAITDLLVYDRDGDGVVTASVKISRVHTPLRVHPPLLWVTTEEHAQFWSRRLPARCSVAAVADETLQVFYRALDAVLHALRWLDTHNPKRVPHSEVGATLRDCRSWPVADVVELLLGRAAERADELGVPRLALPGSSGSQLVTATLDVPEQFDKHRVKRTDSGLYVAQRTLLVPRHDQFFRSAS